MIDIWLVFNLFKPFVDILLHTYVETISDETDFHNYAEEEEEDPTRARSAWSPDKVSKEKAEAVEAMRLESRSRIHLITYLLIPYLTYLCFLFYFTLNLVFRRKESHQKEKKRAANRSKIRKARYFLRTVYPIICIVFIILFWVIGMAKYLDHGEEKEYDQQGH